IRCRWNNFSPFWT
ncbi:short chain dehydrogenase family protein, partial [Vibrio parahaemolyticus AQ3810]